MKPSQLFGILLGGSIIIALSSWVILTLVDATTHFATPSPDGRMSIVKSYTDEDQLVDVEIVENGLFGRTRQILTAPSSGIFNSDGLIVAWVGNRQIIIASPQGATAINGPSRVGAIDVRYSQYDIDLSKDSSTKIYQRKLLSPSISFAENTSDHGKWRDKSTGKPIPEIDCVVKITGLDPDIGERIEADLVGKGIGPHTNSVHVFTGLHLKVRSNGSNTEVSQHQTLTQAQINDITSPDAPTQRDGTLDYGGYGAQRARALISAAISGQLVLLLSRGIGNEISRYEINLPSNPEIARNFNKCSAKTNIYGAPFSL